MDILNKYYDGLPLAFDENGLICIVYYDLQLLLPPQYQKIYSIIKLCVVVKFCTQDRIYQEYLNHWQK